MVVEDIENLKESGFNVKKVPTGYIFSMGQKDGDKGGEYFYVKRIVK